MLEGRVHSNGINEKIVGSTTSASLPLHNSNLLPTSFYPSSLLNSYFLTSSFYSNSFLLNSNLLTPSFCSSFFSNQQRSWRYQKGFLTFIENLTDNQPMNQTNSFEDLIVWKKAHQFVLKTYEMTKRFPAEEKYGLTSQLRRASVSIAANIAEGFKKRGAKDKLRFYNIAQGSLEECRYFLILAGDLDFIKDVSEEKRLLIEVSKLLNAYSTTISKNIN